MVPNTRALLTSKLKRLIQNNSDTISIFQLKFLSLNQVLYTVVVNKKQDCSLISLRNEYAYGMQQLQWCCFALLVEVVTKSPRARTFHSSLINSRIVANYNSFHPPSRSCRLHVHVGVSLAPTTTCVITRLLLTTATTALISQLLSIPLRVQAAIPLSQETSLTVPKVLTLLNYVQGLPKGTNK